MMTNQGRSGHDLWWKYLLWLYELSVSVQKGAGSKDEEEENDIKISKSWECYLETMDVVGNVDVTTAYY